MSVEIKRSVCPFDCPDACGLLVEVSGKKAVKVKGDPQHPFTRGTLCPKMTQYEQIVHSPERIMQPLLRTGLKGSGQFVPISWDEAIKQITTKWQDIIEKYTAEAILPCSYAGTMGIVQRNAGDPFFHRLGASRLERTLCSPAKGYGWQAVMGSTLAPHPGEIGESDLVILWGTNVLAANIHLMHDIRKAKQNGAKVFLIDTYETPSARIADRMFVVRPSSDGALALGMMQILVEKGLVDYDFIAQHVQGFEQLRDAVLPQYTREFVSAITGLDAALIEELAMAYGQAKTPFISLGSGLSRYGNGAMTVRIITCLPAIVGAWAKQGGGLLASVGTGSALATEEIVRPDLVNPNTRIVNINQIGDALTTVSDPPIKSLYVYHSNPAAVVPDQNKIIQGLLREDLFTVVHERFMTDTACYADIVLPATSSLEHADLYRSYGHYCLQRAEAAIPPIGQAKSNWETFCLLAQAMAFEEPIFTKNTDEMIECLLSRPKPWLATVNMSDLRSGMPVELELPVNYKLDFKTPSGKIEIYNSLETEPLPRYKKPHGDSEPFWLMTAPSLYSLNSSFNEHPNLVKKKEAMYLQMNSQDADAKGLVDGQRIVAFNSRGEVIFILKVTSTVPQGVVVADSVFWMKDAPGNRTVNALTSQRLTDEAGGSTFYDTKVDVRPL